MSACAFDRWRKSGLTHVSGIKFLEKNWKMSLFWIFELKPDDQQFLISINFIN